MSIPEWRGAVAPSRRGFLFSLATATLAVAMDVLPRFGREGSPIFGEPLLAHLREAQDTLNRGLLGIVLDLPKGHYISGLSRTFYPKVH